MSKFVSIFKVETTISELKNTEEEAQSHLCKVNNSHMHKKILTKKVNRHQANYNFRCHEKVIVGNTDLSFV